MLAGCISARCRQPRLCLTVKPALKSVVLVDDEKSYTDLITQMLADNLNCPVHAFSRPLDALRALPQVDPGVVVTDYNMPGTSGIEIAREAKQLRPGLPVVLTSGYITAELQSEANAVGVRWLLPKPYWMEEFCRLLQDVLQPTPNPCDVLWRASSSSTTTKPCD